MVIFYRSHEYECFGGAYQVFEAQNSKHRNARETKHTMRSRTADKLMISNERMLKISQVGRLNWLKTEKIEKPVIIHKTAVIFTARDENKPSN